MAAVLLALGTRPHGNPTADPARSLERVVRMPPDVAFMLQRSCYDCHSNTTRWPWYSKVPPGSWMIARDVNHARSAMNFSELPLPGGAPMQYAAGMLMAACSAMRAGAMPHPRYLLLHPEARVSQEEVERFCGWSLQEATRLLAASHAPSSVAKSQP